jgi:hypothetical protein
LMRHETKQRFPSFFPSKSLDTSVILNNPAIEQRLRKADSAPLAKGRVGSG